eukprot:SAG31_NODE_2443_length_5682_cov_3.662428_7_plen_69_part_00
MFPVGATTRMLSLLVALGGAAELGGGAPSYPPVHVASGASAVEQFAAREVRKLSRLGLCCLARSPDAH